MVSTNSGAQWDTISNTLPSTRFRELELRDISAFAVNPTELQTIYAAMHGLLHKTDNGGSSWKLLSDTANQILKSTRYVGISPYNPNTVFAIDRLPAPAGNLDNLFRSADGGNTWEFVGGDFPVSSHGVQIEIAFDPADSTRMYATADNSFYQMFFRSSNGGKEWQMLSYVEAFKIAFTQKNGEWNILNYDFGLYRSNDGGISWVRMIPGLGFLDIVHLRQTPHWLYAVARPPSSFDYGIHFSPDGGESWSLMGGSESLPFYTSSTSRDIHSILSLDELSGFLYAGTKAGIFRYSVPVRVEDETNVSTPTHYQLFQNYPNPFNPTTIIKYSIPERTFIRLIVYDLLGKEVRTLIEGIKEAGNYSVVFHAGDLQSGAYFYCLVTSKYAKVKKMVLIK